MSPLPFDPRSTIPAPARSRTAPPRVPARRHRTAIGALLAAGLAAMAASPAVPGAESRSDAHDGHAHEGDTHEGHGHEGHAHAGAAGPLSAAELFAAKCEHEIPTYTCDECRYELGVVKVPPELFEEKGGPVGRARAEERPAPLVLDATGELHLDGNAEVHVTPRIPGVVAAVHVDIGARARKGDVLFELESAELGQSVGEYRRNLSLVDLARRNHEREKGLFERQIVSEVDLLEAQKEFEEAQTALDAAAHRLRVMGVGDEDLTAVWAGRPAERAGRLPYRATMDGLIIEKHLTVGELAEPGKDVMRLADLSRVWAWLDIYEQDLAALLDAAKKGAVPVEIETRAFPGEVFRGVVDHVGAQMSEHSRTVRVRATLENRDERLRPGMFCRGRLALGAGTRALAVPADAVLRDEGKTFVFRHLKEDYYLRVPVSAGREFAGAVEIVEGLAAGDAVVTKGSFLLKSDVLREKMGAGCAD